jgi:hypothetical protein
MLLTWETAIPPSACAVINVILYGSGVSRLFYCQGNPHNRFTRSQTESNFWFKLFREILGKLYIISLMIILYGVLSLFSFARTIGADNKSRNSREYLTELNNKDVTLQLPTLLPAPVTERAIRTQPCNASLSINISVPVESKHTEVTPEQDEKPPASLND